MIVMNKEKMERYIRNLHRVAWMAGHLCGKGELEEHKDEYKEHMRRFSLDKDAAI